MPRSNKKTNISQIKDIRATLSVSNKNDKRPYFLKSEAEEIIKIITGKKVNSDFTQDFFEKHLADYGWEKQVTIDSHPNKSNLAFILQSILNKSNKIKQEQNAIKEIHQNAAKKASKIVSKVSKSMPLDWKEAFSTLVSSGNVESVVFDKETISVFLK